MDEVIARLRKRDESDDHYCDVYGDCSTWYNWGRWIFVAGIIIAFFILFSLCLCLTRRRRRRGLQPYYGTAWIPFQPAHPGDNSHQFQQYPQQYNPNPNNTNYYAPTTSPPPYPQNGGFNYGNPPPQPPQQPYHPPLGSPGGGYFPPQSRQENGVVNHSTGGTDLYMPPPGPPPKAHAGKI